MRLHAGACPSSCTSLCPVQMPGEHCWLATWEHMLAWLQPLLKPTQTSWSPVRKATADLTCAPSFKRPAR